MHITLSLSLRKKVVSTTTDFEYIATGNAKAAVKHMEPPTEAAFDLIVKDKQKAIDNFSGYTPEQKTEMKSVNTDWGEWVFLLFNYHIMFHAN